MIITVSSDYPALLVNRFFTSRGIGLSDMPCSPFPCLRGDHSGTRRVHSDLLVADVRTDANGKQEEDRRGVCWLVVYWFERNSMCPTTNERTTLVCSLLLPPLNRRCHGRREPSEVRWESRVSNRECNAYHCVVERSISAIERRNDGTRWAKDCAEHLRYCPVHWH